MHKSGTGPAIARTLTALGALGLALFSAQTPAHAAADITNFNVQNCTDERIFVCSYDKTDGSLKIPYKARGLQPGERKEFGCASLGRCKVIIGVSDKNRGQHMVETATGWTANCPQCAVAPVFFGTLLSTTAISTVVISVTGGSIMGSMGIGAVIFAAAVGAAIGSMEVADGWSDGEVCNQVRRAAQKAGMKPKEFMQDGKKYRVVPQYATDDNGKVYVYPDGTAVFTYKAEKGNSCSSALKAKLIAQ